MKRASLALAVMQGMSAMIGAAEGAIGKAMVDSGLWSTPSGHKRRRGLIAAPQKRISLKRKNVLRHRRHVRGRK